MFQSRRISSDGDNLGYSTGSRVAERYTCSPYEGFTEEELKEKVC